MRTMERTYSRHFTRFAAVIFAIAATAVQTAFAQAVPKAVPGWLDTVAPRVEIMPKTVYHPSVFMITLSANKRATFYAAINVRSKMREYKAPISITTDTAITVYYYGEDDLGNRSRIDSMNYVLDTRIPRLTISPERGFYAQGVVVHFTADEPCRFEYCKDPLKTLWKPIGDSVSVTGVFEGFVAAIDSAGNRTVSGRLKYVVDSTSFAVSVSPNGGLFNQPKKIRFDAPEGVAVFYTFDPMAPREWFKKYEAPFLVPSGLNILRYYGKNSIGKVSDIEQEKYILDTIPPKIHKKVFLGQKEDTVILSLKEHGIVRFTLDGNIPTPESPGFKNDEDPVTKAFRGLTVVIPHYGKGVVKAIAWDDAGNESDLFFWERRYDSIPPVLSLSPSGGKFNKKTVANVTANEKTKIYYTVDGSKPTVYSQLYDRYGIPISREGETVVKFFGIDDADNRSEIQTVRYSLDTKPPSVKVQIETTPDEKKFLIRLAASEPASIFYETNGSTPTTSSALYKESISLLSGQSLAYIAVDSMNNATPVQFMDELKKPRVTATPDGGTYNRRVTVKFAKNIAGTVHYRMLPDSIFRPAKDSLVIKSEGQNTLEYYLESPEGLRSPLRRNEYYCDWSPPRVTVSLKKGVNDSVSVFFESTKNATIYYTTDGSNPLFSQNTLTAGNKFVSSRDRVSILRKGDVKLAYYAEDALGNQSAVTVLDVLKPRVIPNVPAGRDRVYSRILSIELNSYDEATIYFARHGNRPTTDSAVYKVPITLIKSDTISAFAVDGSGFRGDLESFIFLIDLPPSPQFSMRPDTIYSGMQVSFDASATVDKESPLSALTFRWDFEGDGVYDTKPSSSPVASHSYPAVGRYSPTVEATDERKRASTVSRSIMVRDRCPKGMVSVADNAGHSFCIDRYESPNEAGRLPQTAVSWVEAKIACIDAGKRLCSRKEWESVCRGVSKTVYPYGDAYEKKKCAVETGEYVKSGSYKQCVTSGVNDMLGNVWEWVEDKHGDYPYMMGGSFNDGKDAHCGLAIPAAIAATARDVGFRCCK